MIGLRILRLCGVLAAVAVALAPGSSAVSNRADGFYLYVSVTGVGGVRFLGGFAIAPGYVLHCSTGKCPATEGIGVSGRAATISAVAAPGWKLLAWHGACSGSKNACVVHEAGHNTRVSVVFAPTRPGIARTKPVPLGTTATIADGFRLRIISVTPNAQLNIPPPAGARDFIALVAATYVGGGSVDMSPLFNNLDAIGIHDATYNTTENACHGATLPSPVFPIAGPTVFSGQTVTGNVCWQIARNDAASLELFIGTGFTHTTWFALH